MRETTVEIVAIKTTDTKVLKFNFYEGEFYFVMGGGGSAAGEVSIHFQSNKSHLLQALKDAIVQSENVDKVLNG
jgi:hypothetical protein